MEAGEEVGFCTLTLCGLGGGPVAAPTSQQPEGAGHGAGEGCGSPELWTKGPGAGELLLGPPHPLDRGQSGPLPVGGGREGQQSCDNVFTPAFDQHLGST